MEQHGPISVVTINRPKMLNALDVSTLEALEATLISLERDPVSRVILVTGAGDRAFVAGGDIADLERRAALSHYNQFGELIHRVLRRFEECDKPTIGAIHGWALGGGAELMLTLDIRLLADDARVGLPEINLGLIPGAGGTQRLIRQMPLCRAKELMFTGDFISANEALALGLCNRVVPKASLWTEAMAFGNRIAAKSPTVLKLLKRTLRQGREMHLHAALSHEHAMASLVFDTEDSVEGRRAFLEKRPPCFLGSPDGGS